MKRLGSSDSLSALMSTDELNQESEAAIYSIREFRTMLDEEEGGHVSEKKRRLTVDQVKALEKSFEVENKLEPERKVKLAKEIGLQPRQVAVWFQNRRARYKTKQLERDYGILKANFDHLKHNYDTLHTDNQALLKQIEELKCKLNGGDINVKTERRVFVVKEEAMVLSDTTEQKNNLESREKTAAEHDFQENVSSFLDFKLDGSNSDSTDSSAILNEENNSPHQFLEIHKGSNVVGDESAINGDKKYWVQQQPQFVKVEEYNFLGEDHDQSCSSLFSDEQAPTLHWYCSDDHWN